jgi:hypothetical protein
MCRISCVHHQEVNLYMQFFVVCFACSYLGSLAGGISNTSSHPLDCVHKRIYRVIKKSLCTWWLQHWKLQVMFKVSPASLQKFIDTPNCVLEERVQYSTVHVPNVYIYFFFLRVFCTVVTRCTETFWSLCITYHKKLHVQLVCLMKKTWCSEHVEDTKN